MSRHKHVFSVVGRRAGRGGRFYRYCTKKIRLGGGRRVRCGAKFVGRAA